MSLKLICVWFICDMCLSYPHAQFSRTFPEKISPGIRQTGFLQTGRRRAIESRCMNSKRTLGDDVWSRFESDFDVSTLPPGVDKREYHYNALEVPTTATPKQVKAAFRRLVLLHHPDRKGGNVTKFMRIRAALVYIESERLERAAKENPNTEKEGPRSWWRSTWKTQLSRLKDRDKVNSRNPLFSPSTNRPPRPESNSLDSEDHLPEETVHIAEGHASLNTENSNLGDSRNPTDSSPTNEDRKLGSVRNPREPSDMSRRSSGDRHVEIHGDEELNRAAGELVEHLKKQSWKTSWKSRLQGLKDKDAKARRDSETERRKVKRLGSGE